MRREKGRRGSKKSVFVVVFVVADTISFSLDFHARREGEKLSESEYPRTPLSFLTGGVLPLIVPFIYAFPSHPDRLGEGRRPARAAGGWPRRLISLFLLLSRKESARSLSLSLSLR